MDGQLVYNSKVAPDGKRLSAVACIVDKNNKIDRVVVTSLWRVPFHVNKGRKERAFVVPNFWVDESAIEYGNWHFIVEPAHKYALKQLSGVNHCGECRACCVAPPIKFAEYTKKAHEPCCHLCDHGCKRYATRPQVCREFTCLWLESQSKNDVMPPELRPDRCGVFFMRDTLGGDPLVFEVHPDPIRPQLMDLPTVRGYIDDMQRAGHKAKLVTHYTAPT